MEKMVMPEYSLDTSLAQGTWAALPAFTRGYIEAAMWTLTDDDGKSLDYLGLHDIAAETIRKAQVDCDDFAGAMRAELDETGADDHRHGVDFWLTRNGHGAGFWDRDYGAVGRRLSDAARVYGSADWYVGDDGHVYEY